MENDELRWIGEAFPEAFVIDRPPQLSSPVVFDSPHSGSIYPERFLAASQLDAKTLRRSEDFYVDELFGDAPKLGSPLIRALFPRAFLDVNREPFELDPALIYERLPKYANTRSLRVAGGLGTIPRVVAEGRNIYKMPLTLAEALARVKGLYKPYHDALEGLLDEARATFGYSVLIDCHSMPSLAGNEKGGKAIDIVLGDRFSSSCSPKITHLVQQKLTSMGYVVVLNKPYAGGYITEKYGMPRARMHALQIEINRALYMSEGSLRKSRGFQKLKADLTELVGEVVREVPVLLSRYRAAAE